MRVLHYLKAFRLEHGGVVRAVLDMADYQARAGARVTIATCDPTDIPSGWKSSSDGLTPRVIVRSNTETPGALVREADIVHLHVIWDSSQLAFARAAKRAGVPCMQSTHGMLDDWSMAQSPLKKRIYLATVGRAMVRSFAAVHCTAEGEAAQVSRWVGPERIYVVPLILDLSMYRALPDRSQCRTALPGRPSAFRAAFLGRLHHKKGLEHLIDAAAALHQAGKPVEVLIGGTGEADYEQSLRTRVAAAGLSHAVHFLGHVGGELKMQLLRGSDALVLPSYQENFGIVLIEAMACQTPVITTKAVDIWPELKLSGGAIIIDRPESSQVQRALCELSDSSARADEMGQAGQRWSLEGLDPSVVTTRYLDLYRRLIADATNQSRPLLAVINNVQTPYRIHLHRRIVREMPEVRLASIYTHTQADQPWEPRTIEEINPVQFGREQPVLEQGKPKWLVTDWRKGGRIIDWLRARRAGAVVIGGYNDMTRVRIIRWCRRAHIPCFIIADSNSRGDFATGLKLRMKRLVVGWAVRNTSGVMPCGILGREFFERYGARADRCFFVPYEPEYERIQSIPESRLTETADKWRLNPTRKRIVVCARLAPVKRVDLAIDAFAAIASQRPDWDLVIIGDGSLRDRLEARVPQHLVSRILWTGFIGDQDEISSIDRLSHILLCPSDWEPWGVVINEAAAAGMAIVASSVVGAAPELVRDGVNGRQFLAGDLASLVACLLDATAPDRVDLYRAGSARVLSEWQREGDPIQGIRHALSAVNFGAREQCGQHPP